MKRVLIKMRYLNYVLFTISIAFFYAAYYQYEISRELMKNGIEAEGTFVDYKVSVSRSEGKETKSYYPIYEYLDDSNNVCQYTSSSGSGFKNIDIGSKVNLLYSKEINQARINSFWGLFSLSIIEIFLGLVAISVMLYLIIKKRKVETG